MNALNHAMFVFVPMLYLGTLFTYWYTADPDRRSAKRAGLGLAVITFVAHAMWIGSRYKLLGHLPLTTMYDSFSFLAFVITFTYIMVETFTGVENTGFHLLFLPCLLTTSAAAFGPHEPRFDANFNTPLFVLHTLPAVGGISAIVVGGIYGLLYVRLARAIQKKNFDGIFRRLPDLEMLARMNFGASAVGLILATAAIGWGATWYGKLFQRVNIREPKIFLTLIIWTVLIVPVGGRLFRRFSDRATAWVAVVTLCLVIVSIGVSFMPGIGFHSHR